MHEVELRTYNELWFGIREPDWEEWEEEDEEFSLRITKRRRKGNLRIRRESKNP
jgi:hypothetical protein